MWLRARLTNQFPKPYSIEIFMVVNALDQPVGILSNKMKLL